MAAIHETAYPRLKSNFSLKELETIFSPMDEEIALLDDHTRASLDRPRLGFMLLLKCYQYLGRSVNVETLDEYIKAFVAEKLSITESVSIAGYHQSARKRHIVLIRNYLNINLDVKARRQLMKSAALTAANTKENLADIINFVIDELIKHRFELPGFHSLLRLVRAARTVVNQKNFNRISDAFSEKQKAIIDKMVGITNDDNGSISFQWSDLKIESKKPTINKIRKYVRHVNQLKKLRDQFPVDLDFIAPARLDQLKNEAIVADIDDMKRMRPNKRYALAVILIHLRTAAALDDLVHVLITWVRGIENQAKHKLELYRLEQSERVDEFVMTLYNTLLAYQSEGKAEDKIHSIDLIVGEDVDALIEDCRDYLGLTGDNHIRWILKPYQKKRSVIYQILEAIEILSSTNDKAIERALLFIKHHRSAHQEWIDIDKNDPIQPDLSLLSEQWFKAVTGKRRSKQTIVDKIHRHYYEVAVCSILTIDLNCSDAYVNGSDHYDDPNKHLVSWQEFDETIAEYCELAKLPTSPAEFVLQRQNKLRQAATKVDENYQENPNLIVQDGKPILKKPPSKPEPVELEEIKQKIMERMPKKNIVEAIAEVENWLGLSVDFKPLSGFEAKISDYPSRFVATTVSYGCNLGPTQTERSILKYTRKQIARLFHRHVTDSRLIRTIRKLINKYNLFKLPKYWGTGDSVSVDGTFWDMYEQNLLAAHHIRYGKYGGVGYYHVSDLYIALFSNFISCGAHESVYLLDGIVENDSDVKPTKVHGDSWAQSEVLYGIAALMSIQLMPRIKHLKRLNFYRATASDRYANIDELFAEKPIDWDSIETHYLDMLRMVLSINKGKIKASTILRKLCSKSRKNKLYFAFRELGRAERTIFLLDYINDVELRGMIQAATCKSEGFNDFIKWIRFGGDGVLNDNMQANQHKIIRFNHLVANMLIFHTVVYQTKAINTLRGEGVEIPDDILMLISPYWTEHLNRFGTFILDMGQPAAEIEYDLV